MLGELSAALSAWSDSLLISNISTAAAGCAGNCASSRSQFYSLSEWFTSTCGGDTGGVSSAMESWSSSTDESLCMATFLWFSLVSGSHVLKTVVGKSRTGGWCRWLYFKIISNSLRYILLPRSWLRHMISHRCASKLDTDVPSIFLKCFFAWAQAPILFVFTFSTSPVTVLVYSAVNDSVWVTVRCV